MVYSLFSFFFFTACTNEILHTMLQCVSRQPDLWLKKNTIASVFESLGRKEIGSLSGWSLMECSEMLGFQSREQKPSCWFVRFWGVPTP